VEAKVGKIGVAKIKRRGEKKEQKKEQKRKRKPKRRKIIKVKKVMEK